MESAAVAISVIIPCYQSAETLGEQLDAVLRQEWPGCWEVVCVYQPSSDETRQILSRYESANPRLRVVEALERRNASYARNEGARSARGAWLLFCDADDVVEPGWVAAMADALATDDVAAGRMDTLTLNTVEVADSRGPLAPIRTWPGFIPYASGGNTGMRHELFDRLGGFREGPPALEDTDLTFRAQLDGGATIGVADGAVLQYRYRTRFVEIARQARAYALGEMWLRHEFEPRGMPALTVGQLTWRWLGLLALAPQLLSRGSRLKYAWRFGYGLGLLQGIWQQRYRPPLK